MTSWIVNIVDKDIVGHGHCGLWIRILWVMDIVDCGYWGYRYCGSWSHTCGYRGIVDKDIVDRHSGL